MLCVLLVVEIYCIKAIIKVLVVAPFNSIHETDHDSTNCSLIWPSISHLGLFGFITFKLFYIYWENAEAKKKLKGESLVSYLDDGRFHMSRYDSMSIARDLINFKKNSIEKSKFF